MAQFPLPPLGGLRIDVRKDQEVSDPVQLWPAPGLSQSIESPSPNPTPCTYTSPI